MIEALAADEIEQFRTALRRHLGLEFDDAKSRFLGEVLHRRLKQLRQSAGAYLHRLQAGPEQAECAALARELTVGETYFFRNHEQFSALAEIALVRLVQANAASRTVRLVSAGCASGEEAYSLAITAREAILDPAWRIEVRAVDINPAALEKARRARYSGWALRETPAEVASKYFHAAGREMVLDSAIKEAVQFDQRNLAADDAELWRPESLDVVFCRNVIMYFAPQQMRALMARIAGALRPGGYLFLGSAESLRGLSDDFELRHTHSTFYYQKKDGEGRGLPAWSAAAAELPPTGVPAAPGEHWIDVIRQASERVAALAQPPDASPPRHAVAAPTDFAPTDFAAVFDLLRQERFADALTVLHALPLSPSQQTDRLLLEAVLLAHSRRLPAAEDVCRRLLDIEAQNAGAHYVYALCRESAGDDAAAAEHDRVATDLDPAFAMPRLHLGLLQRHAGDRAAARRDLAQALVLLKREDEARLLLFGGGFKRQSWLELCESALRDCGGQP